jgi:hypothetical protein
VRCAKEKNRTAIDQLASCECSLASFSKAEVSVKKQHWQFAKTAIHLRSDPVLCWVVDGWNGTLSVDAVCACGVRTKLQRNSVLVFLSVDDHRKNGTPSFRCVIAGADCLFFLGLRKEYVCVDHFEIYIFQKEQPNVLSQWFSPLTVVWCFFLLVVWSGV